MKILIVPSWYPPHGGLSFRDMAECMVNQGHEVTVLYATPISFKRKPGLVFNSDLTVTKENGINAYRWSYQVVPRLAIDTPYFLAFSLKKIYKKYLSEHGTPDVILVNSAVWAGYAVSYLKKYFNVPYVLSEHRGRFTMFNDEAQSLFRWWHKLYLYRAFNKADGIRLVGSMLINGIEKYLKGVKEIQVISNGVDTSFFTPGNNSKDEPFTFISIAGLNKGKGIDLLLSAYKQFTTRFTNSKLIIAGAGNELVRFKQFVLENKLESFVIFKGFVDRNTVRDLLQTAHVFVLPTRFEAQGVVYLEAMSCGLPIIGTEAAPPEIFPDFVGYRIPVNSEADLLDAMIRLYQNYDTYNSIQIREFILNEHDRVVVTKKMVEFLKQVIDSVK